MLIFFGILILIASVLLAIFVLVQNPKGGGLSGAFGGFSNQTMGVRQTTDFLEKGTWGLIIFIAALSLASSFFISEANNNQGSQNGSLMENNITLPTPSSPNATPLNAPSNGSGQSQQAPSSQQQAPATQQQAPQTTEAPSQSQSQIPTVPPKEND